MKLPKYITFDCYGTLIDFQLTKTTIDILGERANTINLHDFLIIFRDIRYFECFGPYQRYSELLRTSVQKSHGCVRSALHQCRRRQAGGRGSYLGSFRGYQTHSGQAAANTASW